MSAYAEACFKQLCCLGLPGQQVMPRLLSALHEIVPSYANFFVWVNARGQISNTLFENLNEVQPVLPLYFGEYADARECEVVASVAESLRQRRGAWMLDESLKVERRVYYRSDFYQLLARPTGFHDGLRAAVCDGTQPLGILGLGRRINEVEFRRGELRPLAALLPYLGHALAVPADTPVQFTEAEDEGLLIVDAQAHICHQSAEAHRLIYLATHPSISAAGIADRAGRDQLHAGLTQLVEQLKASTVAASSSDVSAPPVWRHTNAWGEFVFRAYWMDEAGASGDLTATEIAPEPVQQIVVSVRRSEPRILKLLRRLDAYALSPRQREIGLWLAQGTSFSELARRFDISVRTAETHARSLYDKLDVRNRVELVNQLLM